MPPATFTISQATDLARYFLGPEWRATFHDGACCLIEGPRTRFVASSWRGVFRAAGVSLPSRPRFVGVGRRVMYGSRSVASCVSNSMASRVADALNAEGRES